MDNASAFSCMNSVIMAAPPAMTQVKNSLDSIVKCADRGEKSFMSDGKKPLISPIILVAKVLIP
jgi:hypothetical protein